MPSPVPPSSFQELIPSAGGSVCTKFVRNLLRLLPERIYAHVAYERNPDGTIADGFAADIRALVCFDCKDGGPGPGPGGGLATPSISASDGTFSDKVQVIWPAIVGATSYDVYRSETNTVATAVIIGSPGAALWDDTTVVQGTTYHYWVRAKNATGQSNLSASDSGSSASSLPVITNLAASIGFTTSAGFANGIALIWTPPQGAQKYDIFRSATSSFGSAIKIDSDRVPFDNSLTLDTGPAPTFLDNGGELVYYDQPPSNTFPFWYWVQAKSSSGALISGISNLTVGCSAGDSGTVAPSSLAVVISGFPGSAVPAQAIRSYIIFWGAGGGGAAGGLLYGGGGGGGAAIITGRHNVLAGGKYRIVSTPEADTGRAQFQENGDAGSTCVLQYAPPPGITFSTIASIGAPGGGIYSSLGGGLGGAGATTGSGPGLLFSGAGLVSGRNGEAASGSAGGRSGYSFGSFRKPPAHFSTGYSGDGSSGGMSSGSGSFANPAGGALVEGGNATRAVASIYFFNS